MSRGYRFAVVATLWVFAATMHYLGALMFGPNDALWNLAEPAIQAGFIQTGWRDQFYFLMVQAGPLLLIGFSVAWLFFSEYEAQTTTVRRRR